MKKDGLFEKEDKKSLILRTAIALFAEKEFRNTTISDIAKEAKVAEGLVYYYFISKDDILFSIFLIFWQDFNLKIEQILFPRKKNQKPSERLRTIIKLSKQILAKDKFSLCLLKVLSEPLPYYCLPKKKECTEAEKKLIEKRKKIKEENQRFLSLLDNIITEGLKDKNDNPATIRQGFYGAWEQLFYGLFLKSSGREKKIGYNIKEAENFINKIISLFLQ